MVIRDFCILENFLLFNNGPIFKVAFHFWWKISNSLTERLQQALPITIRFALGNAYENLEDLPNSYIEASSTLEASLHAQKPKTKLVFAFAQLRQ